MWAGTIGGMVNKDLAKTFGIVLRNQRKAAKMSQEALSEAADVDVKMIGRIETFIRNPSLNLADSLAQGLGVTSGNCLNGSVTPSEWVCVTDGRYVGNGGFFYAS